MLAAAVTLALVLSAEDGGTPSAAEPAAAPTPARAAREKLMVLEVKPADDSAKALAAQVLEQVLTELSQDGRYEVLSTADVQQLLGLERQKQLLGCTEDSTSCMMELTDALGAPWLLSGTLGRTETQVRIDLKIVSTTKSTVAARAGKVCTQATLFTTVTEVVEALLLQMPRPQGGALPPSPKGVAQSITALLTNPDIGVDVKRAALKRASEGQSDLTAFIDSVQPAAAAEALCPDFARRVSGVPLQVEAKDPFGDREDGTLFGSGVELGEVPFDGMVPSCVRRLELKRGDVVIAAHELKLSRTGKNQHTFNLSGRPPRWVIAVLGELVPETTRYGLALGTVLGVGGELTYWGKHFHFSLAGKASSVYRDGANGIFTSGGAPRWLPGGDVFLGFTTAFGKGPRVHVALDLGLWTFLMPAGRLAVALNVADRLFVSLAGVLAYYPYHYANQLDLSLRFLGNLQLSVGVGF